MTSLLYPLLLCAVLAIAFATALYLLHRRSKEARQQLAQEIHDRALAFDRRADHLQQQLDRLEMRQRIHQLALLIDQGERSGQLSAAVAERLRLQTMEYHEESSG